jgi:DNA repair protein RadC
MDVKSLKIMEMPLEERPRERLLQYGSSALSHAELLAILLRTGSHKESAIHLAQRILKDSGGLHQLVDMNVQELTQLKGIGQTKATQILASIELGRRISQSKLKQTYVIKSPEDAAKYMMESMRHLQKEHFVVLFLNTKHHIIEHETLSIGSLNASIVHPREVFKAAIKRSSASIICLHNHPSGDPTPSPEDIQMTRRLTEAGEIIGIELLDHIIIADDQFISLKELRFM